MKFSIARLMDGREHWFDFPQLMNLLRVLKRQFSGDERHSMLNPGDLYLHQQRQRAVISLLKREGLLPLDGTRILEVGCGSGTVLREFLWYGADDESLIGIELQDWRLRETRKLMPQLSLINADARNLPLPDDSFDIVMQFTVFSSVLEDQDRRRLADEMRRVLRPGGLVLWYDFWINPINPKTRGIPPKEIRKLFPHSQYTFRRLTLAPPFARFMAPHSWLACYLFEKLRIFNTHYLAAIRPEK
jgi:ubiquinone/menaquinone biosynthesis C-methylase UbiE